MTCVVVCVCSYLSLLPLLRVWPDPAVTWASWPSEADPLTPGTASSARKSELSDNYTRHTQTQTCGMTADEYGIEVTSYQTSSKSLYLYNPNNEVYPCM